MQTCHTVLCEYELKRERDDFNKSVTKRRYKPKRDSRRLSSCCELCRAITPFYGRYLDRELQLRTYKKTLRDICKNGAEAKDEYNLFK
jgi:hypothetical protein